MELETLAGVSTLEGPIILPTGYGNSHSIRIGTELTQKNYSLRTGILYETAGVPENNLSVSLVDTNKSWSRIRRFLASIFKFVT